MSTTIINAVLITGILLTRTVRLLQFNNTNFQLNTTCTLNVPIGTVTASGNPQDVVYQIFGTQDFVIDRYRADIRMVKKPKDESPLFYITALAPNGSTATTAVEIEHSCPTVSFDAVSYHFFAHRRAPGSEIGAVQANGGRNVKYSTDSETFTVHLESGIVTTKTLLPVDATFIFYVKAVDPGGNTDVAEVVVEVAGCYMDVNLRHDRYNLVFDKRCYKFSMTRCDTGTVVGQILAKGYPEPSYECADTPCDITVTSDGFVALVRYIEPGSVYNYNIVAVNGNQSDNKDVAFITVDTKRCPPTTTTTTTTTTTSTTPTTTATTTTATTVTTTMTSTSTTTTAPATTLVTVAPTNTALYFDQPTMLSPTMPDFLDFAMNASSTINQTMTTTEYLNTTTSATDEWLPDNSTLGDIFSYGNDTGDDDFPNFNGTLEPFLLFNGTEEDVGNVTTITTSQNPYIVHMHVTTGNRTKTVRPVRLHPQKAFLNRIFVKSSKNQAQSQAHPDFPGMEIV
ncbi:uncharacterized protein LOC129593598 [Paramacrobiotus metropolitanus]|uniref:uncharacterized protein LOC129593598 n=1 Tax=Paramacrobiotus metropolitanus TaxID=2943436 RepID=UPI00244652AD|nr:uncharacterized protein LOC129593598 [Paramacrobiotus metropolitanus]